MYRSYLPDKLQIVKPLEGEYSSGSAHKESPNPKDSHDDDDDDEGFQNLNQSVAPDSNSESPNTLRGPTPAAQAISDFPSGQLRSS